MSDQSKLTVFLSHSHHDVEKVRQIRNVLEVLNCDPLIFFLQCLDDNNKELEDFIKREIEARSFFLYCKSKNAEKSTWVEKELNYIRSFDTKRLYTVDIENDLSIGLISFLTQISKVIRKNRVFITHSIFDRKLYSVIAEAMRKNDYEVHSTDQLTIGIEDFGVTLQQEIEKVSEEGTYVYLWTKSSETSRFAVMEMQEAIKQGATVLRIISEECALAIQEGPGVVRIHSPITQDDLDRIITELNKLAKEK